MRRTFAVVVGAALVGAVLSVAPASAATVGCGATITTDFVLTKNLACTGNGLLIGATDLSIDLNGKRITGSGSGKGISISPTLPSSATINLKIRNGAIRNFAAAVDLEIGGSAKLDALTVLTNTQGFVSAYPSLHTDVTNSTFQRNGTAIGGRVPHVSVADSRFNSNGVGIDGQDLIVDSSNFRDNGVAVRGVNGNLSVTGSQFVNNPEAVNTSLDGVTMTGTSIRGSDVGLDIVDDFYYLAVQNNTISESGLGIRITGTNGGPTRLVAGNVLSGNGASGLFVNLSAGSVEVSGNTFKSNGFSPATYVDPSGNPLISGAWANAGTLLTRNTARSNAGYGIEGHGVTDGGGNVARGNGTTGQCLGVVCARH